MPIMAISNAAHTAVRRSMVRSGLWQNGWSQRISGTTWWEVEISHSLLRDIQSYRLYGEDLSTTLIRILAIWERNQRCPKPQTNSEPR